jgi:cytochrome c peroxidase
LEITVGLERQRRPTICHAGTIRVHIAPSWVVVGCAAGALSPSVIAAEGLSRDADVQAVSSYSWKLPPGFPTPSVPDDNPMSSAKVELGRRLFRDTRLSVTGTYACMTCHRPELAYTDGKAKAVGATGEQTKHSAMSLVNVAYNASFTWSDPTVRTLEVQMLQPMFEQRPLELGLTGRESQIVEWLSADDVYRSLFSEAFRGDPTPISLGNVVKAIAAFERSLISGRSPFDRYLFDDDQNALSASAKRGMALFYSARVGCGQCHFGLNFSGPLSYRGHVTVTALFANTGLYNMNRRGAYPQGDRGLLEITHNASDMGKMRVPTLRNVALTAPYMHDGSVATLLEVIDHYAGGGRQQPHGPTVENHLVDRRIRAFHLSPEETADMIAFLDSLTDREFIAEQERQ